MMFFWRKRPEGDPTKDKRPEGDPTKDKRPEGDPAKDKHPEGEPPEHPKGEPPQAADDGWLIRLRSGLGKTANKISQNLGAVMGKPRLDASDIEAIEDALITADLGVEVAAELAQNIAKKSFPDGVTPESLGLALADAIATVLQPCQTPLAIDEAHRPHIIVLVGVNGSGKTTTAGKLAAFFAGEGKSVMLAAADTFRAAATEQLVIWGERTNTPVITGDAGADAASVAFKAVAAAKTQNVDILIIDTAGRLQARQELMAELAKIHRVIAKHDATAPHDSIIILDGTVGQNALGQVAAFNQATPLTGMIITKLDGSAHGGIVVALAREYGLPIYGVGVGEAAEDLQPFDAEAFAEALAALYSP